MLQGHTFHSFMRNDLREQSPCRSGKRLRLRVVKNQLAKAAQMEFDFAGGVGVVAEAELVDRGVECGVIVKGRGGFLFDGAAIGRDREETMQRLAGHATLAAQVRTEVRLALGLTQRRPIGREDATAAQGSRGVVNG